jgi:dTMP kinase
VKGLFVTFEGIEGAGKTSRCTALADALRRSGVLAAHTREPGGPKVSERIRDILLDPALEVPARTELLLYLASRSANVELVIRPALGAGSHVLCERFSDATVAYQSGGRGLALDEVEEACRVATGGLEPDLTFLLDIEPEVGLGRIDARAARDRIEKEELEFHRRVRQAYLDLAARAQGRIVVIDASRPPDGIDSVILERFLEEARRH